jgi:hypothetical protein
VKDELDAFDGLSAGRAVADVAFDECEPRRIGIGQKPLELVEIAAVAGGEIIEADDASSGAQQGFGQVRPDEPRNTGDQPRAGPFGEPPRQIFAQNG